MSLVIKDGFYKYKGRSKRLDSSELDIYRALVKLSLKKGEWGYFPNSGIDIEQYMKKRTPENVEAIKKEIRLYLREYNPEIQESAVEKFFEKFEVSI